MKVILEHELLGEQDIIPNRAPRHKCCLSLIHKTRKHRFDSIGQNLGDDFIKDVATRNRPKLGRRLEVRDLRNQTDDSRIHLP